MSRRAVTALAVLATILGLVVWLDRPARRVVPGDARLFPELTGGSVSRVAFIRPGQPPMVVERRGPGFVVAGAPADDAAVREVTDTLADLAARRRVAHDGGAGRGLDPPRLIVELTGGSVSRRLLIGNSEPGLGRVWARRDAADAPDLLLDGHAVRVLDRPATDLRRRAPFEPALEPRLVEITAPGRPALRFTGTPSCLDRPPGCARADARRLAALLDALGDLRVSTFLAAPPAGDPELRVDVDDAWIAVHSVDGACPGAENDRAVSSWLGAGCVPAAQLAAILAARDEPLSWVERRVTTLTAAEIDGVTVGDVTLERRGGSWRLGDAELSSEAVRDWLGALLSFEGTPRWTEKLTGGSVSAPRELVLRAGERRERLFLEDGPGGADVRRGDEPVALRMHPAIRAAWRLDATRFTDRRVINVDPLLIRTIELGDRGVSPETAERGPTLDRWRLTAPLDVEADGTAVLALRDAAARLTARSVLAAAPRPADDLTPPRRRITLTLDAAPGDASGRRESVDLGASGADGCRARRGDGGPVFLLAPEVCARLEAHLATRQLFAADLESIRAVTQGAIRLERHGDRWYRADGSALDDRAVTRLGARLAALAVAPAVDGYGVLAGAPLLTVETVAGKVELIRAGARVARADRPVIYRLAREALPLLR